MKAYSAILLFLFTLTVLCDERHSHLAAVETPNAVHNLQARQKETYRLVSGTATVHTNGKTRSACCEACRKNQWSVRAYTALAGQIQKKSPVEVNEGQFSNESDKPEDYDDSKLKDMKANDDCNCGEDCKCVPDACASGHCMNNYVVMFTANWCTWCHKMYEPMKQLRKEGYIVYFVYHEKQPKTCGKFKVKSFPTIIIMDKGKEVKRFIGVTSTKKIKKDLKTRKEQEPKTPDYDLR